MNFRDAIQEIIKINQVIVDKKLNEILPERRNFKQLIILKLSLY